MRNRSIDFFCNQLVRLIMNRQDAIDAMFSMWKSKGKLTGKGALQDKTTLKTALFMLGLFFLSSNVVAPHLFLYTTLFVVAGIVTSFVKLGFKPKFYPDRIEEPSFFGSRVIVYDNMTMVSRERDAKKGKDVEFLRFRQGFTTISVTNGSATYNEVLQLAHAFRSMFYDRIEYDADEDDSYVGKILNLYILVARLSSSTDSVKLSSRMKEYCIRMFYHGDSSYEEQLESLWNYYADNTLNYRLAALGVIKSKCLNYSERVELLDEYFALAYEDEEISDRELDLLREIARFFLISEWNLVSLEYKYEARRSSQEKNTRYEVTLKAKRAQALELLQLEEDATEKEIKDSYRKLVKECHPDRLPKSMSDAERERSVERFRAITEAYDFLLSK